MPCEPPEWFKRAFSTARLAPYKSAARHEGIHAEELYRWNLQICEAFYPSLSCLETAFRNALDSQLRERFGRADWWEPAPLDAHDVVKVRQAIGDLYRRDATEPVCPDSVVAELSFGFWISLLSRRYDRHFWVPTLHKAFPGYHKDRETLRDNFDAMRRLRNRIMHHEPVHHRHLAADREKIYLLIRYIEPKTAKWLEEFDRVPDVLAQRPHAERHEK